MGIRSCAQNFEDVMLWRALGGMESGFFIDVGAQHPIKDSVSKIFSENGWRGIHVEPTPEYADLLREDRPNDTIIPAVVSDQKGVVSFFAIPDTGLSTGQRTIAEAHAAAGHPYREIAVPALSLDELLVLAPSNDIHWLKIDVEGMEHAVLSSWRNSPRRPWIVVIEANLPGSQTPNHEKWEPLILAKGYHPVYYDGLNRFYVSDDHHELDRHFLTPPNIFDGFQFDITSDHAILIQRQHQSELDALESRVATLDAHLAEMREEADRLGREWQAASEQQILAARNEAAAELMREREWERSRAEAIVAEIHARERSVTATAAAERAALEQQLGTAQRERASLEQDLGDARRKIGNLRTAMIERERELLARADLIRESDAARFEARLSEERVLLLASEERVSAALQQVREMQHALAQAHEDAVKQERATRAEMEDALARLRTQAEQNSDRLQADHQAAMADASARLLDAERIALENAKAHFAAILAQAEAFREELGRIREAAAEQSRQAQSQLEQAERREQETLAVARAEQAERLAELARSNNRISAITSSRSWRLAAPLRWLMSETTLDHVALEQATAPPVIPAPDAPVIPTLPAYQGIATMTSPSAKSIADLLALPAPDFIHQSFRVLLGRDPSPVECQGRERTLHLGHGRVAMLAEIRHSPEASLYRDHQREEGSDEAFIWRAYQHYLGRAADPDGLAHYMDLLQRRGRAVVERDLAASPEAAGNRSLPQEIDRIVAAYRRSRSWWRRLSPTRWERRLQNVQSEAALAQFQHHDARQQEQMQHTLDQMAAMASRSEKAVHALRDQGERALSALEARQKAFSDMAARREADIRAQIDRSRTETLEALALIRDDAQARFDRMVESYRAEQAALAPSIQKVDASQVTPRARQILQRMQIMNGHIGREGG